MSKKLPQNGNCQKCVQSFKAPQICAKNKTKHNLKFQLKERACSLAACSVTGTLVTETQERPTVAILGGGLGHQHVWCLAAVSLRQ